MCCAYILSIELVFSKLKSLSALPLGIEKCQETKLPAKDKASKKPLCRASRDLSKKFLTMKGSENQK
ncbi:MAG: hypothetical protein RJB66_1842 [Pseudomonadota bacterium]|jgi:hypothetical protein